MKPFALVCLPSIATEERALLFKARHFYWTLTFARMRRLTVKRCIDIGDWRCTVRVPDSHHSNPHYRLTDKRLMLCNLQGRGRETKKEQGDQSLYACNSVNLKFIYCMFGKICRITGINLKVTYFNHLIDASHFVLFCMILVFVCAKYKIPKLNY